MALETRTKTKQSTNTRNRNSEKSSSKNSYRKKPEEQQEVVIDLTINQKDYFGLIDRIKKNLKGVATTDIPMSVEPMLATLITEPFNNKDWLFEIKWDGYRSLAYLNKGKVQLRSRTNLNFNDTYKPVIAALKQWPVNAVVDGEIVVLNEEGKADFEALQQWGRIESGHLVYYVFDILWLDGIDLTKQPLIKRREFLKEIIPENSIIRFSDSIDELGKDLFELAKENELEGIIAKEKTSIYKPGKRGTSWYKIPTKKREEFVIGGWTESDVPGKPFRTLLFGYYNEQGKLVYFGHAGLGFKDREIPKIAATLKKHETHKSPFINEVDQHGKLHWTEPVLVADVEYRGLLTKTGKIRHPAVFLHFRDDKKATEVVREVTILPEEQPVQKSNRRKEKTSRKPVLVSTNSNWHILEKQPKTSEATFNIGEQDLQLYNFEKVLWDGVTKADLLQYYHSVCKYIMPHVQGRPLSLHIKHISPTQPGIYIKDMEGKQPEWAELYSMERRNKKKDKRDVIDYLVCKDEATLLYIINLGCIDVNPWTSRVTSPEYPDYIIIDLDPSDKDFLKVIETAKAAKQFFDSNKIIAFPKTSGKTGLHLYLPCEGFTFPEARTIAENICESIYQLVPSITTTEISISARGDKLYLDPNQNDYADTVAAPYSVRPYPFLTVSTPLQWKEINERLDPLHFTIETIMKRIEKKGELFSNVFAQKTIHQNRKQLQKFLN